MLVLVAITWARWRSPTPQTKSTHKLAQQMVQQMATQPLQHGCCNPTQHHPSPFTRCTRACLPACLPVVVAAVTPPPPQVHDVLMTELAPNVRCVSICTHGHVCVRQQA